MIIRRFYDDKLAQASYLIGCAASGEAIVIDPNRHIDAYIDAAAAEHLRIAAVTETHIHADFVSGARALGERLGVQPHLSAEGGPDWRYECLHQPLRHGNSIQAGNVRLDALHTPGHTPEHLSFLLTDEAASSHPLGAFTGDFLFVGDVGRPDLLERAAGHKGTMETGARQLHASLREFAKLPEHILIWPGHGAGSACGKKLSGVPVSSLGYEKVSNWAFLLDEEEFVRKVLDGQPDPPRYFAEMKRTNRAGAPAWNGAAPPRLDPAASGSAQALIDLRSAADFAAGSLPGAICLPLGRTFITWAGSVLNYGETIHLIATNAEQAETAVRDLAIIGLDSVAGWFGPDALSRAAQTGTLDTLPQKQVNEIDDGSVLIDVRTSDEYKAGHIPRALHFPLATLRNAVSTLPRETPLVVHCQGGVRSPVGASLLRSIGFTTVANLAGGYAAYRSANPRDKAVSA